MKNGIRNDIIYEIKYRDEKLRWYKTDMLPITEQERWYIDLQEAIIRANFRILARMKSKKFRYSKPHAINRKEFKAVIEELENEIEVKFPG